jgi:hypothetical protein
VPDSTERIAMSQRERDRLVVIKSVMDAKRTQVEAARHLGLSTRQVRRLQRRIERDGDVAVVHRLRGRPSNSRRDDGLRQRVLALYRSDYGGDYGPTLLAEKLTEQHAVVLSPETLRQWLLRGGLWQRRRKRDRHRRRRARRPCFGELVQIDASHHDWLEGRSTERVVLCAMIDDATSRLHARFYAAETTDAYFDLMGRYIARFGKPFALYSDQAGIFRTERKKRETDLERVPQFARALDELDVRLIIALSPQAKGRIERAFQTLQDRWVKALRAAGVTSIAQANALVDRTLLPQFNERFTVRASSASDAHRPAPPPAELAAILCAQHERTVRNDYTVRVGDQLLQILPPRRAGRRGGRVLVERAVATVS